MNSPITIKEIEFIILKFPEKKSLSPKNKSSYVSFSGKHGRIFPHLFYEVILPIPKPKEVQKREVQTDSSNQYEAKVVNKISANRIQQHEIIYMYIKCIYIMTEWNLFQGCKDGSVFKNESVCSTVLIG